MNNVILSFALVLIIVTVIAEEKYTTKYDNIDLDEIFSNKRLLKGYSNCILNKGPCSPDGAELKKVLPEAISTKCAKCNEKQKDAALSVIKRLIEKEPDIWAQLEERYDPKGTYKTMYKEEAEKEGVKL